MDVQERATGRRAIPPSDQVLAAQALAGHRAACDALFERYFQRVHVYVSQRVGAPDEVERRTELAVLHAFEPLELVARGADLAWRTLRAARAVASDLPPSHASVTQSPR